jgi:hypothetical protein
MTLGYLAPPIGDAVARKMLDWDSYLALRGIIELSIWFLPFLMLGVACCLAKQKSHIAAQARTGSFLGVAISLFVVAIGYPMLSPRNQMPTPSAQDCGLLVVSFGLPLLSACAICLLFREPEEMKGFVLITPSPTAREQTDSTDSQPNRLGFID